MKMLLTVIMKTSNQRIKIEKYSLMGKMERKIIQQLSFRGMMMKLLLPTKSLLTL